jgi:pantetheine-phosphate adenylyltransferase
MRHINEDSAPGIATVFLMPPLEIAEVSSSMVKAVIGPEGWESVVRGYVPPAVFERIERSLHAPGK